MFMCSFNIFLRFEEHSFTPYVANRYYSKYSQHIHQNDCSMRGALLNMCETKFSFLFVGNLFSFAM